MIFNFFAMNRIRKKTFFAKYRRHKFAILISRELHFLELARNLSSLILLLQVILHSSFFKKTRILALGHKCLIIDHANIFFLLKHPHPPYPPLIERVTASSYRNYRIAVMPFFQHILSLLAVHCHTSQKSLLNKTSA